MELFTATGKLEKFFLAIRDVLRDYKHNKKTKGPTLMELFTATGKLEKFFWQLEMFSVITNITRKPKDLP